MKWFVVVPGSLVPAPIAPDVLAAAPTGTIAARLARARRAPDDVPRAARRAAHLGWLWHAFGGRGSPVTAPYAWRASSHASAILPDDGAQWWHCDPIHIDIGRDELLVGRSADAQLTEAEADALAVEADAALRAHDALLKRLRHDAWFVQTERPWQLDAAPLLAARGRPVSASLPQGADAARWRKVLNEIQMRWHEHAVNAARASRDLPPVNGVWLHGGGAWAPLPRAPFAAVVSDDPVPRGWALASGVPPAALHDEGDLPRRAGDALSLWSDLAEPAAFDAWGVWLEGLAAMDARLERLCARAFAAGFESIELVLCGHHAVRVLSLRRSDRLRFWRRAALGELLAEPVA